MPHASIQPIPVIDLFAGPGGLNEGFSRLGEDEESPRFTTIGSFEMESSAIQTLQLRATYRHLLRAGDVPAGYYRYIRDEITKTQLLSDTRIKAAWDTATRHIHRVELGGEDDHSEETIRAALAAANVLDNDSAWVLIGGPPCQAYSLAGRSRRANDETFATDKKHFLYREYLRIIETFKPPVFVMENVKGLLSSKADDGGMFDRIKRDLENAGGEGEYALYSLVSPGEPDTLRPKDFVIRAENFGVPQKRHRVILVGVRRAMFPDLRQLPQLDEVETVSVDHALHGMPPIRSGISRVHDSTAEWARIRSAATKHFRDEIPPMPDPPRTKGSKAMRRDKAPSGDFGSWIIDPRLHHVIQHESRKHMPDDLKRYWYAAAVAREKGVSPRLSEFPAGLLPNHRNATAENHPFEDRFRVQVGTIPSTTVVSHIAKDGHYYIHPDPAQMRSLTVREAARLQTFPDNYFFEGTRTQQYHQVGNAVPPLLANKIAEVLASLFAASR